MTITCFFLVTIDFAGAIFRYATPFGIFCGHHHYGPSIIWANLRCGIMVSPPSSCPQHCPIAGLTLAASLFARHLHMPAVEGCKLGASFLAPPRNAGVLLAPLQCVLSQCTAGMRLFKAVVVPFVGILSKASMGLECYCCLRYIVVVVSNSYSQLNFNEFLT